MANIKSILTNFRKELKQTFQAQKNIIDVTTKYLTQLENAESEGSGGIDYSTEEQDTGLKWIDGKSIYQKTVKITALPSTAFTNTNYAHNISNFGELVDADVIIHTGNGYIKLDKLAYTGNGIAANYTISLAGVDTTNITIISGTDRSSWSAVCTLRYTK